VNLGLNLLTKVNYYTGYIIFSNRKRQSQAISSNCSQLYPNFIESSKDSTLSHSKIQIIIKFNQNQHLVRIWRQQVRDASLPVFQDRFQQMIEEGLEPSFKNKRYKCYAVKNRRASIKSMKKIDRKETQYFAHLICLKLTETSKRKK
jgi:hypothetical protein